ncbi:MAG: helix-turn-helix transcriptional regulator [Clostridia bacterium]|nr:helix-turn-helix transcriptional regulator [Clostridia bacterium]
MEDFREQELGFEDEAEETGQSHEDYVELVRSDMYDVDRVFDLAELFKIFGDSTRLRIMSALLNHELCVCDISEVLEMNQSAISHQLRVLRTAGLIKVRRCGKSAFYSLDDDHVKQIIEMGFDHINEKN